MSERCETVDRLPEFVADRLSGPEAGQVRAHLEQCADCRDEIAVIRALRADQVAYPAGLEERVRSAVRAGPAQRWRMGRVAIAAGLVFTLATAGVVARQGAGPSPEDPEALAPPPWPSADEPLMRGGPALNQLSLDELESLLEELES